MVANVNSPQFSGGANIAIKCPSHTYDQTITFYRDTLGLPLIVDATVFTSARRPADVWVREGDQVTMRQLTNSLPIAD